MSNFVFVVSSSRMILLGTLPDILTMSTSARNISRMATADHHCHVTHSEREVVDNFGPVFPVQERRTIESPALSVLFGEEVRTIPHIQLDFATCYDCFVLDFAEAHLGRLFSSMSIET